MTSRYCLITGLPEGAADPALLRECPPFEWSGEVDRAVRAFVAGRGRWDVDPSRPNRYMSVWRDGARWGVSPTQTTSAAAIRWLRWAIDALTGDARVGLGVRAMHEDADRGVFFLEVDWYEPRWRALEHDDVNRWCEPFLEVLDQLGASGVCHGGLSPSALVVDPDRGEVRLREFPFSHLISGPRRRRVPALGELVGNPLFVAPEVASGERPDWVSDVYSLGASLLCIARVARGHLWRAPYLGVEGMQRRTSLVLEDWLTEGASASPALLGMLEPDPRVRAHMLPGTLRRAQAPEAPVIFDDVLTNACLVVALNHVGVTVPEGRQPMAILEDLADAQRAARRGRS